MSTQLFWDCFTACLLGNVAHVALKMYSLSQDYKKANMEFTLIQYLRDDRWALVADVICSLVVVYVADEWVLSEYVMGKVKTAFILVGFTGSYVILFATSKAKKRFQNEVDKKTDKADGIKN